MEDIVTFFLYPFLFLALYFEVFLILSFFDADARKRRRRTPSVIFPSVSVIIPCYNEERTIVATVDSVLALDYPKDKLSVIVVDDGSTDSTFDALARFSTTSNIRIVHKENGGKHTALNAGIEVSESEFVGCLDADSFVAPDALTAVMENFDDERIGAVTAAMSVHAPRTILERMQQAEYLLGITMRHAFAAVNGLYVTPGPFTIYRKKIFDELGLFKPAHNTEDMEIALRLQRAHWRIQNAPQARVYTKAPKTVFGLIKQRRRWTTGFLRNAMDYRELLANPRYETLGLIVLPFAIFSVYSRIVILPITWGQALQSFFQFVRHTLEVPLSYTFHLPSIDWFFAPTSMIALLGTFAILFTLTFIFVGAYISKTKTHFGASIVWYLALYGLIAPVWMILSVTDVARGVRRGWHA